MTTIPNLYTAAVGLAANHLAGALVQGVAYQLAAGVMAQFFRPLGAGPFAFASLPSLFNVGATTLPGAPGCAPAVPLCVMPPPRQQWTASLGQNGQGSINLGDGYELKLNEHNSEITVFNRNTGETTRIWGDPHVEIDGRHAYDFWGTTTFTLENGTKITINTEQFGHNPNEYVASQLVITRGSQALTVDGISQNRLGDLSITHGNNGHALDAAHRDGFVLHENASGAGWRSEWTGQVATQADLNATRVGAQFGPGSQAASLNELGEAFTGWLVFGALAGAAMSTPVSLDARTERAIERAANRMVARAFAQV